SAARAGQRSTFMAASHRACFYTIIVLLLSACSVGKEFKLPPSGSLVLGKTTPAEVTAMLAQPRQRASATLAKAAAVAGQPASVFAPAAEAGTYELFRYIYVDTTGQVLIGPVAGKRPLRVFTCLFWNGKLVAHGASSSFEQDSTNFDDTKVTGLERNK